MPSYWVRLVQITSRKLNFSRVFDSRCSQSQVFQAPNVSEPATVTVWPSYRWYSAPGVFEHQGVYSRSLLHNASIRGVGQCPTWLPIATDITVTDSLRECSRYWAENAKIRNFARMRRNYLNVECRMHARLQK